MMDPYIDGVVPIPMSQDEQDFLSGNLRRIHAAYDDAGFDLSALPEKAADEIKRMRELADSEGTRAVERKSCGAGRRFTRPVPHERRVVPHGRRVRWV